MYRIIKDNELLLETEYPCFVKYKEYIKSFCVCNEAEAEAILVTIEKEDEENESFYANIYGKEKYSEEFPTVIIEK